jgi:hypothetical protein
VGVKGLSQALGTLADSRFMLLVSICGKHLSAFTFLRALTP